MKTIIINGEITKNRKRKQTTKQKRSSIQITYIEKIREQNTLPMSRTEQPERKKHMKQRWATSHHT